MTAVFDIREDTDVFSVDYDALAHGTNGMGAMGAGIAKPIKYMFPENYQVYHDHCVDLGRSEDLLGGSFLPVFDNTRKKWVFNLFCQHQPGHWSKAEPAEKRYEWCKSAFSAMFNFLATHGSLGGEISPIRTVAMPAIGAGISGLDWEEVFERLVEANTETSWDGKIIICFYS